MGGRTSYSGFVLAVAVWELASTSCYAVRPEPLAGEPIPRASRPAFTATPPRDSELPPAPLRELEAPEAWLAAQLATRDPGFAPVNDAVVRKRWKEARRALAGLLTTEEAAARLDVWAGSKALAARLASLDGDDAAARAHHADLLRAAQNPRAQVERVVSELRQVSDGEELRGVALLLTAVGQAHFATGEALRVDAGRIVFPKPSQNPEPSSVETWVEQEVIPWLTRRRQAIEEAERAFANVRDLQPAAPPRWTMAAAERIGAMWGDLAEEIEHLPMPSAWANDPAFVYTFRKELHDVAHPFRLVSQAAFRDCIGIAERQRIVDDHTRTCQARLAD